MDKSCIRGHHVLKDFCTPVNNEVASYAVVVKMGSFGVGHTGAQLYILLYSSFLLQTRIIMASVRDSHHYSNNLLQGS